MGSDKYIRAQSQIRPVNDNNRASVTDVSFVAGASQTFLSLDDLIAFHPDRMKDGMQVSIINYPNAGDVTDYYLQTTPGLLKNSSNETIVTSANFHLHWKVKNQITNSAKVFNYAPDKSGGGKPTFPYTSASEASDNWDPEYDATIHRWIRWRTDDVDDNDDGVFDNWTPPLSLKESFSEGDYIENRFKRQVVSTSTFTSSTGMTVGKYYLVKTGNVVIGENTYSSGNTFLYDSGDTLTFNSASVIEWLETPAFVKPDGTLNNEPTGWTDTPPEGLSQLWQIEAQKSVYGQLKSNWRLKKIIEDAQYVRYSNSPTPLPSSICAITDTAASGTSKDTALNDAGWRSVYTGQSYIATRSDDNGGSAGPPFTEWVIDKIKEESGEYTDYVFKLFDVNISSNDVTKPTVANPASEGFYDTPQPITNTKINYVFYARKFANGELKTEWSDGTPWNGESTYLVDISARYGANFVTDQNGNTVPSLIYLDARVFRGTQKLWEDESISLSFQWKKVYDDGSEADVDATSNTSEDFYHLNAGLNGLSNFQDNQSIIVKPDAVTGKAVFRCTVTISMDDSDDLIIDAEKDVADITDGIDAKDLTVRADNQRTIYDTVNTVFVPATLRLRAYQSNLNSPTYYWYRWNGSAWVAITTGGAYTVSGEVLTIVSGTLFTGDSSAEEERIAVSTHDTNPDSANYSTTFSDFITLAKLSSAGVGDPGENAVAVLLDNESTTLTLDKSTGSPKSGETGSSGRNTTNLQLWDGNTKKIYSTDYTVAVSPDTGDIQFAVAADGNDAKIYIDSWTSTTARNATCTITITYGSLSFVKTFQVATTLDGLGAKIIRMISDKGFSFTPTNRSDKTLTAELHDSDQSPSLQTTGYDYRWKIAGSWTGWTTTRTQALTRANINSSDTVTLEVRVTGETNAFMSVTENFADITDHAVVRMMTDAASVSSSNKIPVSHVDDSDVTVSGAVWKSAFDVYWLTNKPTFASDGYEDPSDITKFIWSEPYRISGESGDQGPNGDFYFKMYKQNGTLPNGVTSTLAQMTADGWKSPEERPNVDDLYEVTRRWNGEGVSFTNGYPDTDPSAGSEWSQPTKVSGSSGSDGNNGADGADGANGWSPVFSVYEYGEKRLLQLTDWTGGEGTKPGYIGYFVTASGLNGAPTNAIDIRGDKGDTGDTGPTFEIEHSSYRYSVYADNYVYTSIPNTALNIHKALIIDLGVSATESDSFLINFSVEYHGGHVIAAVYASTSNSTSNSAYLKSYIYCRATVTINSEIKTGSIIVSGKRRYVHLCIQREDSGVTVKNLTLTAVKL